MAAKSAASAPSPGRLSTPDRPRFALTSPSRPIDLRLNAARRDLADIALAGRWFAPHYSVPEPKTCHMAGADILATATADGQRISQLLPGETFRVVETSGAWAWGYGEHDHYVGYVAAGALAEHRSPTHVADRATLVFHKPSSHARVAGSLPAGSPVGGAVKGDFLVIEAGYVPVRHVSPIGDQSGDPVGIAGRFVGMPYLWGGRGMGGIDCSGLVQVAHALAGVQLPRDSDQQILAGAAVIDEPRRGDLLFFPDHVGMLVDDGQLLHASGHWMGVVIEPLSDVVARQGEPTARRRVTP